MHLTLSRATEADFDELLEVQFRAFHKVGLHEALFGPNDKHHRDMTKERFLKDMKEDPADCWMKLVDTSTGKLVSAAQWKIYPTWAPLPEHPPFEATWFEGEEKQMAEFLCADFMERRAKHMYNHAHVCTSNQSYLTSDAYSDHFTNNIVSSALHPFYRPRLPTQRRWLHPREMGHRSCRSPIGANVG
jgi:hypothetical protein